MLKVLQDIPSTRVMSCHTVSKPLFFIQIEKTLSPPHPFYQTLTLSHLPSVIQISNPLRYCWRWWGKWGGVYSRLLCGELCASLINYIYTGWSPRGAASGIRNFVVTIGLSEFKLLCPVRSYYPDHPSKLCTRGNPKITGI
jgi:hypothetical protein